jgi:hypothetical protein
MVILSQGHPCSGFSIEQGGFFAPVHAPSETGKNHDVATKNRRFADSS